MSSFSKHWGFSVALVAPAAVVLIVIAGLQYRWSNQASQATSVRLADSLRMSMIDWHLDLFRNLAEACLTMRASPDVVPRDDVSRYQRGYQEWKRAAAYPDLIANLYVVQSQDAGHSRVVRLDSAAAEFVPQAPGEKDALSGLRAVLERHARELLQARPGVAAADGAAPHEAAAEAAAGLGADQYYRVGDPLSGWMFEPRLPALVRPVLHRTAGSQPAAVDWIILQLNMHELRTRLLPDLARRYFQGTQGLDYDVMIVNKGAGQPPIYSTDPSLPPQGLSKPDATMDIFGPPRKNAGAPLYFFHEPSPDRAEEAFGAAWFPLLDAGAGGDQWQLLVRHRGQSHGEFVSEMRRRDLSIGFGALLVLAISTTLVILSSMRAQRLARVQMDFVATVSHELRTPLAVINSAADNLADGVAAGRQQSMEYGSIIKKQARQLIDMVEQILLLRATRSGQHSYHTAQLSVAEIIDTALANSESLIQGSGCSVDLDVQDGLPPVSGDFSALVQCVQNLISNAVKYGGEGRWVGVSARLAAATDAPAEVLISVADHGIGIDESDRPHIFEPFFRSPSVRAAQIHGTGLGLPLARSIAEAMKGRLEVESAPGRGSRFTLHLPVSSEPDAGAGQGVEADASQRQSAGGARISSR